MSAIDSLLLISQNPNLMSANLKLCLIDSFKLPYKANGDHAKSNHLEDFVNIEDLVLQCNNLQKYEGVACSVQASNICAVDIDHCFDESFNLNSINNKTSQEIIDLFKEWAYIEFSFSGTGLRILFRSPSNIENYTDNYYIKNSKIGTEFYQPDNSYRYVSITGNTIYNNDISPLNYNDDLVKSFLTRFMVRPKQVIKKKANSCETHVDFVKCMNLTKKLYLTDCHFQDLWFSKAPGSGKDESERDYKILCYLYERITTDKDVLKKIFEESPYYKSKDWKHINKWKNNNNKYFYYMYGKIDNE